MCMNFSMQRHAFIFMHYYYLYAYSSVMLLCPYVLLFKKLQCFVSVPVSMLLSRTLKEATLLEDELKSNK